MPGFGLDEGLNAQGRERGADAGVLAAGPGQARADAVAAVDVGAADRELGEYSLGSCFVLRVDGRGEAVFGVGHRRQRGLVVGHAADADDRPEPTPASRMLGLASRSPSAEVQPGRAARFPQVSTRTPIPRRGDC